MSMLLKSVLSSHGQFARNQLTLISPDVITMDKITIVLKIEFV